MEKRACERIAANLPVKYYCEHMLYDGIIKNLSENGMYINTTNFLPCRNRIKMIIPLKNGVSTCKARIRRIEKINAATFNIGVELLNPPAPYIQYVENLKTSSHSS